MDGNATAEASITPQWLPDSPKTGAPCGNRRTSAGGHFLRNHSLFEFVNAERLSDLIVSLLPRVLRQCALASLGQYRSTYQFAMDRNQTRYFALKLPIAADTKTATFAYVDPGRYTDTELRSWGAAHEWLWRALRLQGIEVRAVVIGADYTATMRAEAALKTWSSRAGEQSSQREYGPSRNDPDVQAEIKYIETAIIHADTRIIAKYGGVEEISDRLMERKDLPKSSGPGATIDDYETWVRAA